MSRLEKLSGRFDVAVIGGGVHGAAAALEAVRRGCRVLLVERGDFAAATSANSLRIIHGGLRYLQSADLRRSRESAGEQRELLATAPHLVAPLPCLMATGRSLKRGRLAMRLGLWFYDHGICAGLPRRSGGRLVTTAEANRRVGMSLFDGFSGAALWHEARVTDAERLVLTYLKTAERAGAVVLNYTEAAGVAPGEPNTLEMRDLATGRSHEARADAVIDTASLLAPHRYWARAANLVLARPFPDCAVGMNLEGRAGEAGRLLFAVPLAGRLAVGTWYFEDRPDAGPGLSPAELEVCLADARRILPGLDLQQEDVARIHVGRLPVRGAADPLSLLERPVIRPVAGGRRIVTVTGVKYTTARPTARKALRQAGLGGAPRVETRPWYGGGLPPDMVKRTVGARFADHGEDSEAAPVIERLCRQYGDVAVAIAELAAVRSGGFERIPGGDGIRAEIDYCIEHEHCRTLADFLLRRSGLGAAGTPPRATIDYCAAVMAERLGWGDDRVDDEVAATRASYPLPPSGS